MENHSRGQIMYFIVNGYDHTDENALARRMEAREEHMKGVKAFHASKNFLFAAAMLNEQGNMCGSTLMVDFEDRVALDKWLEEEAYVIGNVWERVEVVECKIPPMFLEGK